MQRQKHWFPTEPGASQPRARTHKEATVLHTTDLVGRHSEPAPEEQRQRQLVVLRQPRASAGAPLQRGVHVHVAEAVRGHDGRAVGQGQPDEAPSMVQDNL